MTRPKKCKYPFARLPRRSTHLIQLRERSIEIALGVMLQAFSAYLQGEGVTS
jgi:hypothetical protein